MENNMPELKPCPFCGGTATRGFENGSNLYFIRCVTCKSHGRHVVQTYGFTQDEADIAWNTRTPAPTVPSEVVEALEDLKELEICFDQFCKEVNRDWSAEARNKFINIRQRLTEPSKLEEIIRLIEAEKWKNKSDNIYNDVHNNAIDKAISIIRETMGVK